MPSTQRIRTHNSHRHNTTPPFHTLVQAPYTTATQTQTLPCFHRIAKAQTQSSYPPHLLYYPEPNTYTFHTLQQIFSFHSPPNTLQRQHYTLDNTVEKGLNQMDPPARTLTVALNMSKAFDTNINTVIRKLLRTNILGTIKNYI